MKSFKNNLTIFIALLAREVKINSHMLFDNMLDSSIIVCFVYLIYGNLLPVMGMDTALITPVYVGTVILILINVAFDRLVRDALDFDYIHFINYQLALPIASHWLIAKYVVSYTVDLICASLPVVILGRLIFGSMIDISQGSYMLFVIPYVMSAILVSILMLLICTAKQFWWIRDNTWPRILLPMTLFGSLYYPWTSVFRASPVIGYVCLCNPSIYMVEGMRSALTGSDAYIAWYWCAMTLVGMCVVSYYALANVFRKRFDLIPERTL